MSSVGITIVFPPLVPSVTSTTLNYGNTTNYSISGGTGNYYIWTDCGSLSDNYGSGVYTTGQCISDNIYFQDSVSGIVETIPVIINSTPLVFTLSSNSVVHIITTNTIGDLSYIH